MLIFNARYTPDYNPIERFFNTVKAKFCSKQKITSFPKMTAFILEKIEDIPKEKFVNYFLGTFYSMTADLIRSEEPDKYGAPEDKLYEAPLREEEDVSRYNIFKGRYIVKDKDWQPPENY